MKTQKEIMEAIILSSKEIFHRLGPDGFNCFDETNEDFLNALNTLDDFVKTTKHVYRGFEITFNPKPIGTKSHDWDAVHDDYDGENGLYLTSSSVYSCKSEIDDLLSD